MSNGKRVEDFSLDALRSGDRAEFARLVDRYYEMIYRLADDHRVARLLALGLSDIPGIKLDAEEVRTNIVFFDLDNGVTQSAQDVAEAVFQSSGVLIDVKGDVGRVSIALSIFQMYDPRGGFHTCRRLEFYVAGFGDMPWSIVTFVMPR